MLNVLMFYALYAAGFLASSFRNPVYAFTLYEAVYFFNPQQRWWGNLVPDISYSFFVVVLLIGLTVVNYGQIKQNKLLSTPQFRWMYVFLFLYFIAYFYAVLPEAHFDATIYFVKLIFIVSIAYKLCDSDTKLNYILYGYIFGAWYIGFVAFQTGRNWGARVEGIGTVDSPDSNGIAAAIAPSLVLCLYYFWTSKNWLLKGLVVIAGVFIANGLVLINSRGAFLAAAAGLGYFMFHLYFSSFQRKYQKSMAIFITVAGLAGSAVLVDTTFVERIKSISSTKTTTEQESGSTRTYFWKAAWEMTKDHPFGTGYRSFNYYAPLYIPENIHTGGSKHRSVHSTWFETLTEVGYLGLFVFILMLYSAYRTLGLCKKMLREANQVDKYFKIIAIQAAFIAFIIAMSFLNRMRAEILYWLILYTACAYNIYVLKTQSADTKLLKNTDTNLLNKIETKTI